LDEATFCERETDRFSRLLCFVRGEVLNMQVHDRIMFAERLLEFLTPETKELIRKDQLDHIKSLFKENLCS
jgi:hypothetical protein